MLEPGPQREDTVCGRSPVNRSAAISDPPGAEPRRIGTTCRAVAIAPGRALNRARHVYNSGDMARGGAAARRLAGVQRIPRGDVTTLHGDGGAGKTDIALRLAANVARGAPDWFGHEIASGSGRLCQRRGARARNLAPGLATQPARWLRRDDANRPSLMVSRQEQPARCSPRPIGHGIMHPTPLMSASIEAAIAAVAPGAGPGRQCGRDLCR